MISYNMQCCGLKELSGLSSHRSPGAALKTLATRKSSYWGATSTSYENEPPRTIWAAHVIFTQAGKNAQYGYRLKDYIEKHDLGQVLATYAKVNPNSGNPLVTFIWTLNRGNWVEWVKSVRSTGKLPKVAKAVKPTEEPLGVPL